jgi:hypothetical protein
MNKIINKADATLTNIKSKTDIIKTIVWVGFIAAILYHWIQADFMGLKYYPYNTFLFDPHDRFNVFFNIYRATVGLNPYSHSVSVYFPFTFAIMYLFTLLSANFAFILLTVIYIGFFVCYIFFSSRTNKLSNVFVFTFLSYPVWFIFDRGNLEALLFIFLALFAYFYQNKQDLFSVIFLSFTIAMKLYPAVFLVLFLADKKYKNFALTIILTLVLTLLSAAMLKGGIVNSFIGLREVLAKFNYWYVIQSLTHGIQHGVSIFGMIKIFLYGLFLSLPGTFLATAAQGSYQYYIWHNSAQTILANFYKLYPIFALLIFVALTIFILKKEHVLWKRISLLVFSMLLLPQVSFDYKLISIFIPLMLFINYSNKPTKYYIIYSIMFGLLLIPKDYYILVNDVSIAVIINPLIMIIIASMIIFERFSMNNKLRYQNAKS